MAALIWLWIAFLGRRLKAALGTPKLSVVMSVLFVCLSIPILIFILLYNYHTNSAAILSTLHEEVAKTNQASIESTENLIQPVASTLRLLASAAAADPAFFRTEQSRDFLYQALTSAPQIDAAYVSFEDGYHRVVTRIDDDRRRSDPQITPTANWHSSYIDDFSAGKNRARHRTFFDTWPHVVGQYESPTTMDIRTLQGYQEAKESRSLVVTEPSINPDTGYPVIFCEISDRAQRRIHRLRVPRISHWISCRVFYCAIAPVRTARRSLQTQSMAQSLPIPIGKKALGRRMVVWKSRS